MPFQDDANIAAASGPYYGKYKTSFRSDGGQVYAHLFEQRGRLVAHVAFSPGLKPEQVTDRFVTQLQDYAKTHGFADNPKLILADQ